MSASWVHSAYAAWSRCLRALFSLQHESCYHENVRKSHDIIFSSHCPIIDRPESNPLDWPSRSRSITNTRWHLSLISTIWSSWHTTTSPIASRTSSWTRTTSASSTVRMRRKWFDLNNLPRHTTWQKVYKRHGFAISKFSRAKKVRVCFAQVPTKQSTTWVSRRQYPEILHPKRATHLRETITNLELRCVHSCSFVQSEFASLRVTSVSDFVSAAESDSQKINSDVSDF